MNPNKLEQDLIDLGSERAVAKGQVFLLEANLKRIKAVEYQNARLTKSQGDAENAAILTEAYQLALERLSAARTRYERADVAYHAKQAWFEAWRTMEATKRAEMGMR